jgi:hypothetical protein
MLGHGFLLIAALLRIGGLSSARHFAGLSAA